MNSSFFQILGTIIDQILETVRQVGTSDKMAELMALFSLIVTLVIMWKGLEAMLGKSQAPITELLWDISAKLVAITFALNLGGWLDLVINAMDGIYEWAGGGSQMYKDLDRLFEDTIQLMKTIWLKSSGLKDSFMAVVAMGLCILGFGVAVVPALGILVITSFTQTLLVISAPIVFWLLIFKTSKQTFGQWLNLLLANTLVILLVGLFFKVFVSEIGKLVLTMSGSVQKKGVEILAIGGFMLIACVILAVFIVAVRGYAQAIAQISMENSMGGAISSVGGAVGGLAGATAGKVTGKAVNTAGTVAGLGGKGALVAGKSIGYVAKGGFSSAKKLYSAMRNKGA